MFLHRICRLSVLVASTRPIAAYSVSDGAMVRPCFELGNARVNTYVLVTALFVGFCAQKLLLVLGGSTCCFVLDMDMDPSPMSFWIRRATIR